MHKQTPEQRHNSAEAPHIQLQLPLEEYYYYYHQHRQHQQQEYQQGRRGGNPIVARMGVVGEWRRGPVIGRGASATVSIATDALTGDSFAVKSVGIALAGALRREQSVLSALSSPYVVSCVGSGGSSDDGRSYELFLELAPGGSLADEMRRCGGRCEEALVASRAGDVLRGLAHVHGAGIAHCDVKTRNVLLGADGRAKLADFGCARWTTKAKEDGIGNAAAGKTMMIMGTPMFMSPEAARGEAQGAAADIWALGCTVIEMATGGAPWRFSSPVAALHHVAHSGDVPESPAWFSEQGKDFLARCLVRDPTKRWTAEQLLEHPFVAAAAASSSSKLAAPIAQWVSPKSVLDQDIWEDSSSTDSGDDTTVVAPADRVRALAAAECSADCWTWSGEEWITVCGGLTDTNALSPTPAAERTDADGSISSNGDDETSAGDAGVDAPRGHGSSHGSPSSSSSSAEDGAGSSCTASCRCRNGVVSSSCNSDDDDGCKKFGNGWHLSVNFNSPSSDLSFTFPRACFAFLPFLRATHSVDLFRHVTGVSRD